MFELRAQHQDHRQNHGVIFVTLPLQSEIMRGIEFEVVWSDQDVIEYQVTCSNRPFRGATKMYLAHDDMAKTAEILSGFPSHVKDARDIELGAFKPNIAGGRHLHEFPLRRFSRARRGGREAPNRWMHRT